MNKTQELQKKADLIKNSSIEVEKSNTLEDVYSLIDNVNDAVSTFYSHIGCKNKCFLCCQHSNIPTATSVEWKPIYQSILDSTVIFQKEIINKTLKLFENKGRELKNIHFALNGNDSKEKLFSLLETLPKFVGGSCIFLKNGSCSIYEVRPGKCRTQGYSIMEIGDSVQFQTCSPEIEKMEHLLEQQGNRKVLFPVWNDYEKKIQSFADDVVYSILPVWIYSHIEDGKLIPEVNLNPDFEKILKDL